MTTELERILADGDAGEILLAQENEPVHFPLNGILILAKRYLQPGPDTDTVKAMDIDWDTWPMTSKGLPDKWWLMPKGLIMNYFGWKSRRNKEAKA